MIGHPNLKGWLNIDAANTVTDRSGAISGNLTNNGVTVASERIIGNGFKFDATTDAAYQDSNAWRIANNQPLTITFRAKSTIASGNRYVGAFTSQYPNSQASAEGWKVVFYEYYDGGPKVAAILNFYDNAAHQNSEWLIYSNVATPQHFAITIPGALNPLGWKGYLNGVYSAGGLNANVLTGPTNSQNHRLGIGSHQTIHGGGNPLPGSNTVSLYDICVFPGIEMGVPDIKRVILGLHPLQRS